MVKTKQELLNELMLHIVCVHCDMGGKHKYGLTHKAHEIINKIKAKIWRESKMHDDLELTSEPGMVPEDVNTGLVWYGVYHKNNRVTVKRYFGWADYKEAGDSDFVAFTTRLFEADSAKEALAKASGMVKERCLR